MIHTITGFDRTGLPETFEVSCEEDEADGYPYYCFEIKHPIIKTDQNFLFEIARISNERMMIIGVNNMGLLEYSGKGIIKAMIRAVSEEFNCDVVSSSSNTNSRKFSVSVTCGIPYRQFSPKEQRSPMDN